MPESLSHQRRYALSWRTPLFLAGTAALVALSGPAMAQSTLSALPTGQNMSFGGASHPRTVQNTFHNPASLSASDRRGFWTGMGAFAVGYEFGPIDNLEDRVDRIADELDRDNLSLNDAEALKLELDELLVELGRDGYLKLDVGVQPPLMPLGVGLPVIGGEFAIGLSGSMSARVSILDAPIEVQSSGDDFELFTNSSAYVKGGIGATLSLGYSSTALFLDEGQLLVGGRLNYYTMELTKSVISLDDSDSDNLGDDLRDEVDDTRRRDTALGLDLGVIWDARTYRLGGTLRNLNEPTLRYPDIGTDCANRSSEVARTNCFTAAFFGDRISTSETHTMERQLQLEGAVFSENRNYSLSGSYDVNASRDLVGDAQQWATVTAAYSSHRWWMPGVRVGYRTNRV
ncbi:MAG: hypothetical protein EA349_13005, partial [Halomonadaceae bacterium]